MAEDMYTGYHEDKRMPRRWVTIALVLALLAAVVGVKWWVQRDDEPKRVYPSSIPKKMTFCDVHYVVENEMQTWVDLQAGRARAGTTDDGERIKRLWTAEQQMKAQVLESLQTWQDMAPAEIHESAVRMAQEVRNGQVVTTPEDEAAATEVANWIAANCDPQAGPRATPIDDWGVA